MRKKIFIALIILVLLLIYQFCGLCQYLTLDYLKANQAIFLDYYAKDPALALGLYGLMYVLATALSIPGALILTLGAGALFGLVKGTLLVTISSTLGATLSFLMARYFLRDWVQGRFGDTLRTINEGIEKEGAFYIFTLRLIPLFPFFMINLAMGITPVSIRVYALTSLVGMFPATVVYVNAGTQLVRVESLQGILSPPLILSFALLGIVPLLAKKIIETLKRRRIYQGFKKPAKFDYNMVVIGAGSAGLSTAYICATVKAKVALIEEAKMGGDCLNTGCVPSKALIRSAKMIHYAKRATDYGLERMAAEFDFSRIMARVHSIIRKIEPHDSAARYTDLGVECIQGRAEIISPWEVSVNGKNLTTRNITIATGARPFVPPIPGIETVSPLTSDNLWDLRDLPARFVVLGGGPIGSEMAQTFARFGSKVMIVEMLDRIMAIEDPEVSKIITEKFQDEGIEVLTGHKAKKFEVMDGKKFLIAEFEGREVRIDFDEVLVAVGRKANIKGFGLESLQVPLKRNGAVEANEYLQTPYPNVYVCGDATGPFQLTHTAGYQAWFCAVNGLFGSFKKFRVDYRAIPWCTYTDPEIATVGMNEQMAHRQGVDYELTEYGLEDLDRAIADSEANGIARVLTKPGTDRIIGATIVGAHASDLLLEFTATIKHGFGLNKILGTVHTYPTMGEANRYLAGNWKKGRTSDRTFRWLERFHAWNRG